MHMHVQVRGRPGTACPEALDTLAVVLLCEVDETTALEAFVNPEMAATLGSAAGEKKEYENRGSAEASYRGGATPSVWPPSSRPQTPSPTAASAEGRGQPAAAAPPLPCQAALRESVGAMEGASRWHALALTRAARNHLDEALAIWRGLAEGRLKVRAWVLGSAADSCSSPAALLRTPAAAYKPRGVFLLSC